MESGSPLTRTAFILLLFFSFVFIGATCSEEELQSYMSAGTNHVFSDQDSVDYVLVLDRSGSMRGEKIEQAKSAATELVNQLSRGDRAAILGFDTKPVLYTHFSSDVDELENAISSITTGDFTRYTPALQRARELFSGNRKVIMFLSDGKPDDDRDVLLSTVNDLVDEGICLFTIAYADSADADAQSLLQQLSESSKNHTDCGGYYRAGENEFELRQVFGDIYKKVSSDALIDIDADVQADGDAVFVINAHSALNERNLADLSCYSPDYRLVILRNKEVVHESDINAPIIRVSLPAGEYEYFLSARETCGGDCFFTGETQGSFTMDPGFTTCDTVWQQLSVLLTSREYVEVHITKDGFNPQTIGTDGVVVWKNLDDVPHRVHGTDGSFMSPVLQPGDSWTRVFPPGTYTYADAEATVSGMLRNDRVESHDPVDLVLVLDRSGSMAGQPLSSAKIAAENLLSILTASDRASLIIFSDRARVTQSLTSDQELLRAGVESVRSDGSTFYSDALHLAGEQLSRSGASRSKLVLFLSDGAPFDHGGKDTILTALDESLGDACLYAIGYGEQGVEAISLLQEMASFVQEKNGCGLFYFSTANKEELSSVFGEIYALSQDPGLDIYDVTVPENLGKEFEMSVKVRSRVNGISVPSASYAGCVPPAEVYAVFSGKRFPLAYDGKTYAGTISLPPGEHLGVLTARVSAPDQPARVVVGSTPVTVNVQDTNYMLWASILFGALFIAYIFIRPFTARPIDDREN